MPTSVKSGKKSASYGSRSTYSSRAYDGRSLYGNTSSAYDIPPAYPGRAVKTKQAEQKPQAAPAVHLTHRQIMRILGVVAVAFVFACIIIYGYTAILESNQAIKSLEKQYTDILAANQALQTQIDRGLEMGEIEQYAREELGMMKPESYQMFYVDMKLPDDGAAAALPSDNNNVIAGTPGALVNAFRVLK